MKQQYLRVMHHIGGFTGKNDNSEMLRGGSGDDELNLITLDDIPPTTDLQRLGKLGALRPATPEEVKRWEISQGIRTAADYAAEEAAQFTTGNQTLQGVDDPAKNGAVPEGGGADNSAGSTGGVASAGHAQVKTGAYKGMSKGELSELSWPELQAEAKAAGIKNYNKIDKATLLAYLSGERNQEDDLKAEAEAAEAAGKDADETEEAA